MTTTVDGSPDGSSSSAGRGAYPRRWWGLFAILTADMLNILDSTVGAIALPSIRDDLGGSQATLRWVVAAYTLAMAVGLLTGGRLGDMFGRKRLLAVGLVGFLAASLLCAVAVSPAMLITARVLQGLSGAVLIPQGFGLIRDMFGREVGKAFAVLGPVFGLAAIIGPVVAGLLIDADVFGTGWRMIFAINLPLGAFALIAGTKVLPSAPPVARGQRLDVFGALLAGAAMLLLVLPLVQGHELGWPTWMFVLLAAAVVLLGTFARHQVRRARRAQPTLVALSVFAKRSYTAGVAFVIVFFGAITGFSLSTGLFLQLGLGYGPLGASLAMVSWAVGAFVGSGISGALRSTLGRQAVHIGLALMTAGLIGLWLVFDAAGIGVGAAHLTAPLAVFGVGMGMIFVPLFDIIVGGLDDHEVGSASGMLEAFQQLGATLGVAVLGTVFFGHAGFGSGITSFLDAAKLVTALTIGITAAAFVLCFQLPTRARAHTVP